MHRRARCIAIVSRLVPVLLLAFAALPSAAVGREDPPAGLADGAAAVPAPSQVIAPAGVADFGGAVAMSGNWAAIAGAAGAGDPGTVYVYQRAGSTWVERVAIAAPEGAAAVGWGSAVAVSGTTLAIATRGAVGIYGWNGRAWRLQATLPANPGSGAGLALALAGDTLIVGESDEECCHVTGAAAAYTRDAAGVWHREAVFTSGSQVADGYGYAVGVAHDFAFVGSPLLGRVDVYQRRPDGWHPVTRLTAPLANGQPSLGFGGAIAASNRTVAIGGDGQTVHLFIRQQKRWVEQAAIAAPAGAAAAAEVGAGAGAASGPAPSFGLAVALSLDTLVVASPDDDTTGAAYVYKRGQGAWNPVGRLAPSGAAADRSFAKAVAASDHQALVGAADAAYAYDDVDQP
jgi:hypothetical protein